MIASRDLFPGELALFAGLREPIGFDGLAPYPTKEAFLDDQRRLFAAYDVLLPLFEQARTRAPASVRPSVTEFRSMFSKVTEAPLERLYHLLGAEWFAWLERSLA